MINAQLFRRARRPLAVAVALVAAALAPTFAQEAEEESTDLYIHLETPTRLSYAGEPTRLTILFKNEGEEIWTNPGIEIEAGFQAYDDSGNKLEKKEAPASLKDAQPKVLEPNGYFGKILDLNTLFPKMAEIGSYRVTWSAPGYQEQSIVTRVIKKYDSERDYQAIIETEFGSITLEFYKDLAPLHVKNFIDLANQGFYDGKLFHRTIKGGAVFGGSPTGDERGPGYSIQPEPNGLKILAGSVAQVRNALTGPHESGSIFMIAASAQPNLDNRFTVFARVAEGLETVKAITNLPSVGGTSQTASRPIQDVIMKSVEIREKKTAKGS